MSKEKVSVYVAMDPGGNYVAWDDNDDVNERLEQVGFLGNVYRTVRLDVEMTPPADADLNPITVTVPDETVPPPTVTVA